jgi:4-hydroxy-tetrahydrodipicolinate synthase
LFTGSFAALVTPFKDGSLDEKGLRENVRFQIRNGSSGLVPCGTTGESPTLSLEEWKRVVEISVEEAKGKVHIIAGTGTNSTSATVERTMMARDLGAAAALVVTPYYNKPTQDGLYEHYRTVAVESRFPLVLYNVPGRTGVNLYPETVRKLSMLDEVVALKDASGDLAQAGETARLCKDGLDILSGDDILTLPLLALGARGVISVIANILPSETSGMISSFLSGNVLDARLAHERLLPVARALFLETNPIPVKAAMEMLGMPAGSPRLPLTEMSEKKRALLRTALAEYGLLGSTSV